MDAFDTDAPEYLTVKELAELLRLKERKIYDLAASGDVPCSRATGKLLFPATDVRAWLKESTSGGRERPGPVKRDRPPILLGSHDPLLDWAVRESGSGLASYVDGSLDGLDRFARGEGVAAGLHIYDAPTDTWNTSTVSRLLAEADAVLIGFARRSRGLILGQGIEGDGGLEAVIGRRFVPRQPGSGSTTLFHALADRHALALDNVAFTHVARTEDDAADRVRRGEADLAFGLEASARSFGLGFAPIIQEDFALIIDRQAYFELPLQTLLNFCRNDDFTHRAEELGGYDLSPFGEVLWNS